MASLLSGDAVKLYVAVALILVWFAVLYLRVPGADDLIAFCKYALVGLASHWLTNFSASPSGTAIYVQGDKS